MVGLKLSVPTGHSFPFLLPLRAYYSHKHVAMILKFSLSFLLFKNLISQISMGVPLQIPKFILGMHVFMDTKNNFNVRLKVLENSLQRIHSFPFSPLYLSIIHGSSLESSNHSWCMLNVLHPHVTRQDLINFLIITTKRRGAKDDVHHAFT